MSSGVSVAAVSSGISYEAGTASAARSGGDAMSGVSVGTNECVEGVTVAVPTTRRRGMCMVGIK